MTHDMRQMTALGRGIEDQSFAIIDSEVGPHDFSPAEWEVTRRVIHATADFEFRSLMSFRHCPIDAGVRALRGGCPVLVDVKMIAVGLNEDRLASYGCRIHSFISDEDVVAEAKSRNSTRAIESMRKAHRTGVLDGAVVAIGNAPTALLEIVRLVREEGAKPVGFVSAESSKEALAQSEVPSILARGRKGGSPIAVAVVHALLLLSTDSSRAVGS
jgi:precorrin-8X/cobalt-precorrin-8 methylmutase